MLVLGAVLNAQFALGQKKQTLTISAGNLMAVSPNWIDRSISRKDILAITVRAFHTWRHGGVRTGIDPGAGPRRHTKRTKQRDETRQTARDGGRLHNRLPTHARAFLGGDRSRDGDRKGDCSTGARSLAQKKLGKILRLSAWHATKHGSSTIGVMGTTFMSILWGTAAIFLPARLTIFLLE
jgi:hypothetical protein